MSAIGVTIVALVAFMLGGSIGFAMAAILITGTRADDDGQQDT